jgi:hypothetical protein
MPLTGRAAAARGARAWLTRRAGTRGQPPKPVNDRLGDLIEALQNATDPWLLFLCVRRVAGAPRCADGRAGRASF